MPLPACFKCTGQRWALSQMIAYIRRAQAFVAWRIQARVASLLTNLFFSFRFEKRPTLRFASSSASSAIRASSSAFDQRTIVRISSMLAFGYMSRRSSPKSTVPLWSLSKAKKTCLARGLKAGPRCYLRVCYGGELH